MNPDDFNEIVDLVWNTYLRRHTNPQKPHLVKLKKELLSSIRRYWNTYTLDREDIEQELRLLERKYLQSFSKKRRKHTLKEFVLQCCIFGMRTWFHQQLSSVSHGVESPMPVETCVLEFQLDLRFLLHGTDYWPLCNLSPYERYLIFLRFKEDKSIVEIAYIVQKHREVISKQLRSILNRLRSEINENENSR